MAKDLPYFKFYASEHLLGRIAVETFAVKGMFTDACSHYWHKECDMNKLELNAKLGKRNVEQLIERGYINDDGFKISIPFLDEQFLELSENKKFNSENGKKGASKRWGGYSGANGEAMALRGDKEENKIRRDKEEINVIDVFFKDLENSMAFESICKHLQIEPDFLKTFIPAFRVKAELKYQSFDRFVSHFKNYVTKEISNATKPTYNNPNSRNAKSESLKNMENLCETVLNANNSPNG